MNDPIWLTLRSCLCWLGAISSDSHHHTMHAKLSTLYQALASTVCQHICDVSEDVRSMTQSVKVAKKVASWLRRPSRRVMLSWNHSSMSITLVATDGCNKFHLPALIPCSLSHESFWLMCNSWKVSILLISHERQVILICCACYTLCWKLAILSDLVSQPRLALWTRSFFLTYIRKKGLVHKTKPRSLYPLSRWRFLRCMLRIRLWLSGLLTPFGGVHWFAPSRDHMLWNSAQHRYWNTIDSTTYIL